MFYWVWLPQTLTSAPKLPQALQVYHQFQEHHYTIDGVILYKESIVIPAWLWQHILNVLHLAHQGVTSMTAHAEAKVFWPGITAAIRALHHSHWGHSDVAKLRITTAVKIKFCEVDKDGHHNDRKRKICTSCQNHIHLETKCDKLEVKRWFLLSDTSYMSQIISDKCAVIFKFTNCIIFVRTRSKLLDYNCYK